MENCGSRWKINYVRVEPLSQKQLWHQRGAGRSRGATSGQAQSLRQTAAVSDPHGPQGALISVCLCPLSSPP